MSNFSLPPVNARFSPKPGLRHGFDQIQARQVIKSVSSEEELLIAIDELAQDNPGNAIISIAKSFKLSAQVNIPAKCSGLRITSVGESRIFTPIGGIVFYVYANEVHFSGLYFDASDAPDDSFCIYVSANSAGQNLHGIKVENCVLYSSSAYTLTLFYCATSSTYTVDRCTITGNYVYAPSGRTTGGCIRIYGHNNIISNNAMKVGVLGDHVRLGSGRNNLICGNVSNGSARSNTTDGYNAWYSNIFTGGKTLDAQDSHEANMWSELQEPIVYLHDDLTNLQDFLLEAATGDETAVTIDYTTNKASSGADTGLKIAWTDTASPGTSKPLEVTKGGTSIMYLNGGASTGNELSVADSGSRRVAMGTHSTTGTYVGSATAHNLAFMTGNSTRWTIDTDAKLTSSTISLNNATGNESAVSINYTTNKATSGSDTGLNINQTDTASPGTSNILALQKTSSDVFTVDNTGSITKGIVDGGGTTRIAQIQSRRDENADWDSVNPVLSAGEFGYDSDEKTLKIGDGSTAWKALVHTLPRTFTIDTEDSVTGTTLADSTLLISIDATGTYNGRALVLIADENAVGTKLGLNGPTTSSLAYKVTIPQTSTTEVMVNAYTWNSIATSTSAVYYDIPQLCMIDFSFIASATGTLTVRWAQTVNSGTTRMIEGSSITITKVL